MYQRKKLTPTCCNKLLQILKAGFAEWRLILRPRSINTVARPPYFMKKILLALTFAAVTVGVMTPAFADEYHHHHPVCHKVKVHGHWEKRCH